MTNANSSGLKRTRGSREEVLAAWLNSDDQWGYGRKTQRQIISLIEQFAALREQVVAQGIRVRGSDHPQLRPINRILAQYPSVLTLLGFSGSGEPVFLDMPTHGRLPEEVLSLMHRGLIDRLRRCALASCRRWFFARRPEAEWCKSECKQKNYRSTEKYKKRKREYMRNYYRKTVSTAAAKNVKPIRFKKKKRKTDDL